MRKIKSLATVNRGPIAILVAALVLISALALLGGRVVLAADLIAPETTTWKNYQDPDYSFALQYNASSWKPVITVYTPNNPDPQVIAKRVSFFASKAEIRVDIWEHPEKDLIGWVKNDTQQSEPSTGAVVNARVAGLPSVAYFEAFQQAPSVMSTVLSNDHYFVRIQYVIGDGGAALDTYLHMLASFALAGEPATSAFQFPPTLTDKTSLSLPATNTCCGYTWAGNPFPCDNGNCTWWAYYRQGYVPFYGDAWRWWSEVPQFSEWSRSSTTPVVEGLAWWNKSTGRPSGHVAQVLSVSGNNIRLFR